MFCKLSCKNEVIKIRKRTVRWRARLTPDEDQAARLRLEKSGLPIEEHIRQLLLTGEVRVFPDEPERLKLMAAITKEVNAIGTNINQIAHAANISQQAPESRIAYLLQKFDEVVATLNKLKKD